VQLDRVRGQIERLLKSRSSWTTLDRVEYWNPTDEETALLKSPDKAGPRAG
jgi:hypothetical protein